MAAADVNKPADVPVESTNSNSATSDRLFSQVSEEWSRKPQGQDNKNEGTIAGASDTNGAKGNDATAATKKEGGDGILSAGQAADAANKDANGEATKKEAGGDAAKKEAGGDAAKKDLLDLSERDPLDSGLRHINGAASKLAENAAKNAKDASEQSKPEQVTHARPGFGGSAAVIESSKSASEPHYSPAVVNKELGAAGKEQNAPGADRTGTRQSLYENGPNSSYFNKDDNSHLPVRSDGTAGKINQHTGKPERTGKPETHPDKKADAKDKADHSREGKETERARDGKDAHKAGDAHKPGEAHKPGDSHKPAAKQEAINKPSTGRTRDASPMLIDEKTGELSFPKIDGYDAKDATSDNTKVGVDVNKPAVAGDSKAVTTGDAVQALNYSGTKAGSDRSSEAKMEGATADGDGQRQLDAALQRMRDGGLLKDSSGDGKLTNEELRAGKFETNADKFTDSTSKKEFANQVKSVLDRQDISAADKASILDSGQNIVEMKNFGKNGMTSQADRELLTTSMFENIGNWNSISQGNNGTCALTEITAAQSYLNPAQVAKDTQNVVEDGVWNTKSGKEIDVHKSFMKPDAEASQGLDKDANGRDLGNRNFHTQLMNGKDGSYLNQQQGLTYTNGTAKDGYTEGLWKKGTDANGKSSWELVSSGSPDTDSAEVANMAKHDDYGMGKNVTIAADKSHWADSKNLTDSANLNQTVKDIEAGKGGDKHYLIMLGAGGDKLLQNGRDVDAGAHSGHAYGAAFSKTANINDRVAGEKQGGEWKAKNTWSDDLTASMDKTLVGADGKMNVAAAQRSMDMSINRDATPQGGQGSYREWVDTHPGGTGLDPKDPDALKKEEDPKKKLDKDPNEQENNSQKDKVRKAELDRAEGVRTMGEVHNLRAQQDIARQNAASAKGGDALAFMSAAAALEGRVADLLPKLQIA